MEAVGLRKLRIYMFLRICLSGVADGIGYKPLMVNRDLARTGDASVLVTGCRWGTEPSNCGSYTVKSES